MIESDGDSNDSAKQFLEMSVLQHNNAEAAAHAVISDAGDLSSSTMSLKPLCFLASLLLAAILLMDCKSLNLIPSSLLLLSVCSERDLDRERNAGVSS